MLGFGLGEPVSVPQGEDHDLVASPVMLEAQKAAEVWVLGKPFGRPGQPWDVVVVDMGRGCQQGRSPLFWAHAAKSRGRRSAR
jgi:hypothetical protein